MQEKLDLIHDDVKEIKTDLKDHMGRLAKAENDITWIKGHINLTVGAFIAMLTGIVIWWMTK